MDINPKITLASLAAGMSAAGLQVALFLILLVKMVYPQFDPIGTLSVLFFLGVAGAGFYGFWLLRSSPELSYFVLAAGSGLFLFLAAAMSLYTVGIFMLPGGLAILAAAAAFLLIGEGRRRLLRGAAVVVLTALFLSLIAAQVAEALYLVGVPIFGQSKTKLESKVINRR